MIECVQNSIDFFLPAKVQAPPVSFLPIRIYRDNIYSLIKSVWRIKSLSWDYWRNDFCPNI